MPKESKPSTSKITRNDPRKYLSNKSIASIMIATGNSMCSIRYNHPSTTPPAAIHVNKMYSNINMETTKNKVGLANRLLIIG